MDEEKENLMQVWDKLWLLTISLLNLSDDDEFTEANLDYLKKLDEKFFKSLDKAFEK